MADLNALQSKNAYKAILTLPAVTGLAGLASNALVIVSDGGNVSSSLAIGINGIGILYTGTLTETMHLGTAGVNAGTLSLAGLAGGKAIIKTPNSAGSPVLTLPNTTGTLALTSDILVQWVNDANGIRYNRNVGIGVNSDTGQALSITTDTGAGVFGAISILTNGDGISIISTGAGNILQAENVNGVVANLSNDGVFTLGISGFNKGKLKLSGEGSGVITIQAPTAGTWTWTIPNVAPVSDGDVMTSLTTGVSSWTSPSNLAFTGITVVKNQNATTLVSIANSDTTDNNSRSTFRATSATVITEFISIGTIGGFIGTQSNHSLFFITNGSAQLIISNAGVATFSSTIITAAPSGSSASAWLLGTRSATNVLGLANITQLVGQLSFQVGGNTYYSPCGAANTPLI